MYRFFKIYLIVFLFLLSALTSYGADIAKIGVVDFQRILKESDAGKAVAQELREEQRKRTKGLKDKQKEILKLQKYIESIELVGTKEEREEKKLELNIKIEAFKALENEYSMKSKAINNKYSDRIKDDLNDLIVRIGKKGGYLLIVEKGDVLYAPNAIDITTKLIKEYNRKRTGNN